MGGKTFCPPAVQAGARLCMGLLLWADPVLAQEGRAVWRSLNFQGLRPSQGTPGQRAGASCPEKLCPLLLT